MAPEALDLILLCTATPDRIIPSTACVVQAALGASRAAAMDISAACSGFLYGLHLAAGMVSAGLHRNVLVIGAETLSRFLDAEDRQSSALFGDGAGAAVVCPGGALQLLHSAIGSDGRHADLIHVPAGGSRRPATAETVRERQHTIHLRGPEVFKMAVRRMAGEAQAALEATGLELDDIDWLVPHQANARILTAVAQDLGFPLDRLICDLGEVGNTSAASIPITLARMARRGQLLSGQTILLLSFGAGVTWGGQVLRLNGPLGG
jgi:3-oxoacyl-[acyl-carrier-protein] synthase-3